MNIIKPEFKILEMSYFLLGKSIFKSCIKQKASSAIFCEFCKSQKSSAAFRLKYCDGFTVKEIAERLNYDERSIYKQFDTDMSMFGRWLAYDCSEAEAFEQIRIRLEKAVSLEYHKREIATTDSKSWHQLRSDCLKALD